MKKLRLNLEVATRKLSLVDLIDTLNWYESVEKQRGLLTGNEMLGLLAAEKELQSRTVLVDLV